MNHNFQDSYMDLRTGKQFKRRKYIPIDANDLEFIHKELDWELEHVFGYQRLFK